MVVLIRLLSVAVLVWSLTGCRAREIQVEAPASPPDVPVPVAVAVTHPSVPPPPPVSGPEDRLWVSLQAHLGRSDQSGSLTLHGAGGPLSLRDASGRDWSGSVLTITDRKSVV